jgi:hypothetical protein
VDEFIAGLIGGLAVIVFGGLAWLASTAWVSFLVMAGWNIFLFQLHFVPAITYWQAVGATLLIQIIGGSFKAWSLDLNKETK